MGRQTGVQLSSGKRLSISSADDFVAHVGQAAAAPLRLATARRPLAPISSRSFTLLTTRRCRSPNPIGC